MRRLTALVATLVLLLAMPAAAGGPNQVVTAAPSADGAEIHRSAVRVFSTGADSITSTNLARATPRDCTGCKATAVSFQAIIVTGNPSEVRPTNAAIAVNSECTNCSAYAYAYQYVVSAERGTRLSDEGRAEIRQIRREANELVSAGVPTDQLNARLRELAAQFKSAVLQDLERKGAEPHDRSRDADVDEAPVE